jgi:hypothetical protein
MMGGVFVKLVALKRKKQKKRKTADAGQNKGERWLAHTQKQSGKRAGDAVNGPLTGDAPGSLRQAQPGPMLRGVLSLLLVGDGLHRSSESQPVRPLLRAPSSHGLRIGVRRIQIPGRTEDAAVPVDAMDRTTQIVSPPHNPVIPNHQAPHRTAQFTDIMWTVQLCYENMSEHWIASSSHRALYCRRQ